MRLQYLGQKKHQAKKKPSKKMLESKILFITMLCYVYNMFGG